MKRFSPIAPIIFKVILPALILIAGCMVGPDYHPPAPKAPATWAGVTNALANAASITTTNTAELARWWEKFRRPKLTALVEEALRTNLDVRLAEASLRQARAARGVIAGGLWPGLTGTASYARLGAGGVSHDSFQAGLDAVWELDIFGGIRRNLESANANIQAAKENIRDVQVTLISEVAVNYIQLRSFQEQIDIANENLKSELHTAEPDQAETAGGLRQRAGPGQRQRPGGDNSLGHSRAANLPATEHLRLERAAGAVFRPICLTISPNRGRCR